MRPEDLEYFDDHRREQEPEPGWHWCNCRSLGLGFEWWLWPLQFFSYGRRDDLYGGSAWVNIGPFCFKLHYSIGNCSADWPENLLALSEAEAYSRVAKP